MSASFSRWNPWRGLGALPRKIWIHFAATLVNRLGTMAIPFLVLYLTQDVGFTAVRAGLILSLYGAGSLVVSPFLGRLADRVGHVRMMKASLLSSGLVMLAYPLARTPGAIAAVTIALAVTAEAFRPASLSVLTDIAPPDQRKAAFAVNRLAINLGMSIGPAVGGYLAEISFPAIFRVDGTTSLLAYAVLAVTGFKVAEHALTAGGEVSAGPRARDRATRTCSSWRSSRRACPWRPSSSSTKAPSRSTSCATWASPSRSSAGCSRSTRASSCCSRSG
jgi:MFS family permease